MQTFKLPLILGVTGHRDLREEDVPAIETAVRRLFEDLQSRFPHTPIAVLSQLAEGADQLVARVGLEQGASLVGLLPMKREVYEKDFLSAAGRAELDRLAAAADICFELPVMQEHRGLDPATSQRARDHQYAVAGAMIVRQCRILIAVWDGQSPEKEGGTSHVIRYMLHGAPQGAVAGGLFDPETSGPVYHILASRREGDSSLDAGRTSWLYPDAGSENHEPKQLEESILHNLDLLNGELDSVPQAPQSRDSAAAALLDSVESAAQSPTLERLARRFGSVDALAIRYQQRTLRALSVLLWLTFLAVMSFQIHVETVHPWLYLSAYVFFLAAAFGCFYWSKSSRYEKKYLDYRALAEGLRVQFFWTAAGIGHCAADYYLRRQRGVLEWIRAALSTWSLDVVYGESHPAPAMGVLRSVAQSWVTDQAGYFSRQAHRQQRSARRLRQAAQILLGFSVLLAAAKVIFGKAAVYEVSIAIPPVIAAFLLVYSNTRALAEHAYQYANMAHLFATAHRQLEERLEAGDTAGAQTVLLEIGKEALAENADWLTLHRQRPLETPSLA